MKRETACCRQKDCGASFERSEKQGSRRGSYLIGVDGGGTKTVAAISDLNGRVLKSAPAGPSNPRNLGIEAAAENISAAIKKVLTEVKGEKNILAVVIGLAAVEEEFRTKKEAIKAEIIKQPGMEKLSSAAIKIVGDPLIAFRAASEEKDGVVLIAGTGTSAYGWQGRKETKVSGWGWLADEGSAFWSGQKTFQAIFQSLDGRLGKTLLTSLVFKRLGIKDKEELLEKIYSADPIVFTALLSIYCDEASRQDDKAAKKIMKEAGTALALSANTVIKKLGLAKKKFPLVLIGGMFKSKVVLEAARKGIRRIAGKAEFILPKEEPVIGALKLAKELAEKEYAPDKAD